MNEKQKQFVKNIRVNIPSSLFFSEYLTYREIKLYIIISELAYQMTKLEK